MFRAILCPSSGAREYYTDGRCLWYLLLWFSSCRYGVELGVMFPVCRLQQQPANRTHLYNTLELLMMGIVLPETCWACNKICNKYHLLHLVGILFPHNNDDELSKSLQISYQFNHRASEMNSAHTRLQFTITSCCLLWVILQHTLYLPRNGLLKVHKNFATQFLARSYFNVCKTGLLL